MRHLADAPGAVLDLLGSMFPDSSRTTLRQMLQAGRVRVNGEVVSDARTLLAPSDLIEVLPKGPRVQLPAGVALLHEDDDVLVVFKSHGLLTVATEREREATVQAYLNRHQAEQRGQRVHVVHRLDRETSGILVFAKHFEARERLKEQFAAHTVDRLYVAIIEGKMPAASGTIRSHLREMQDLRMKSVDGHPDAKLAITHYATVESNAAYSMLEVTLETGRKNQIRAHLSEAGRPIVGDRLYGSEVNPIDRLALHARRLGFDHPESGTRMTFESAVPSGFRSLFRARN